MTYLYKPRHTTKRSYPHRLPVAAAAAVLAMTAIVAGTVVHRSTAVRASDAQALIGAEPSGVAGGPAARNRQRTQPAPQAAGTASKAGSGGAPASKSAAPTTTAAPSSPAAPATTAAPVSKNLSYQFAWQENYYFCGPAATRIALTARGLFPSQSEVARSLGTTVSGTNSADDTTRSLNAYVKTSYYKSHFIRGQAATQPDIDQLRADVVKAIGDGYAVVANIAGTTVDDKGRTHSYEGGHYLTVVGYDNAGQTVKIADPADASGTGSYTMTTVKLAHWIALRGYSA